MHYLSPVGKAPGNPERKHMKPSRAFRGSILVILSWTAMPAALLYSSDSDGVTAVSGRTSKDYVRTQLANGSFAPESYAFGKGGIWTGETKDASIDKLTFLDVAHVIAVPLASQNYLPSTDPNTTKLLIMVYWGTTRVPDQPNDSPTYAHLQDAMTVIGNRNLNRGRTASTGTPPGGPEDRPLEDALTTAIAATEAANRLRDQTDYLNAKMLGYDSWWANFEGDKRGTAFQQDKDDLLEEIEDSRYFVVLMAYDFQFLWKEKKTKLLWETRFSIRQRHHEFDKALPSMAQYASQYFGQDSRGLVRKEIPLGHVEVGQVKSLGEVEAPAK